MKRLLNVQHKRSEIHIQSSSQPVADFSASVLVSVALNSNLPDCAGSYRDIHNL